MTCCKRSGVLVFLPVKALFIVTLFLAQSLNAAGNDDSWSFVFLADSRSSRQDFNNGVNARALNLISQEIARDIKDKNIRCELVLFGGDLILGQLSEDSTKSNLAAYQVWKQAMKPVYEAFEEKNESLAPIYVVRGNHEAYHKNSGTTEKTVRQDWMSAFGSHLPQNGPPPPEIEGNQTSPQKGLNYFVKHKDVLFVAVDQYVKPGYQASVNQPWLDHILQKEKTGPHVFVFGHSPAWPTLMGRNDKSLFNFPEIRDKFWETLERAGCRVYLTGHQHYTSVNKIKREGKPDMWQVMSGSAGAPLSKSRNKPIDPDRTKYLNNTNYGYYLATLNGHKVTLKFKYYSENEKKWAIDKGSVVNYSVRQ